MSEHETKSSEVLSEQQLGTAAGSPIQFKFGLATAFLIVAVVAAGLRNWQVDQKIKNLELQMPGLREAARELVVDDASMFAVVKRNEEFFGESIFDVHLPEGQTWRLCMALDKIDEQGLAQVVGEFALAPGRHMIEVRYEKEKNESIASVLADGTQVIQEARPKDWEERTGSSGGAKFSSSAERDISKPLVLYRTRFMQKVPPRGSSVPKQPSAGILVWVEKAKSE